MPKEEFVNGKLTIRADQAAPEDRLHVLKKRYKGQNVSSIPSADKDELLVLLAEQAGLDIKKS